MVRDVHLQWLRTIQKDSRPAISRLTISSQKKNEQPKSHLIYEQQIWARTQKASKQPVTSNRVRKHYTRCKLVRGLGTLRQALRFPPKRHGTAPAPYRTSHFPVSRSHDQPKWSRKTQRDGANPIPDLALSRQMVSFFTFFFFLSLFWTFVFGFWSDNLGRDTWHVWRWRTFVEMEDLCGDKGFRLRWRLFKKLLNVVCKRLV